MKKLLFISALSVFSVLPLVAQAEPSLGGHEGGPRGEKMMDRMFEKSDLDKDGAISKEEFVKTSEERFTKMDADGDGKVTKEEAKKHHEEKRQKMDEMKAKHGTPEEVPAE